jgi:pimeloyl-ACP methyl ester carboxylesterase
VLRSDTDHGRITATVALTDTDRAPERLVLTLPHPDGCPILKAELEDGTPLRLTTDARAVVLERPAAGELRIEARFRSGYARLTDWDVREWHNPQVPPEWGAYRLSYTSPADGLQDWALVCPGRRGDTSRWLVYIHGHGSTGDQLFTRPDVVAGRLLPMRELGLPILSVNLRGNAWMGPEAVADLHAVLEWCRNRYGVREFHFASASMGGTSNLIYAVRHPGDVASVAAGCPATDLAAYHRWLAARRDNGGIRDQIRTAIEAAYGGTPDQRPEVYTQHSVLGNAQRLTMPVFLDHGAADGLIPVEQSRALAQACGDRAGFAYTEYPGGDHDEPLRHAAVLDWLRAQLGTAE